MKNILKKNQLMITALAIMIAIAGYLQFAGDNLKEEEYIPTAGEVQAEQFVAGEVADQYSLDGLLELSEEDLMGGQLTEIESLDSDAEVVAEDYLDMNMSMDMDMADADSAGTEVSGAEIVTPDAGEIPGEAVFTASGSVALLSEAKLEKEQVRAKNKETLLEIINSTALSEEQKQNAVDAMVEMTGIAEKEMEAELLLEAKGFGDVVVSISSTGADVVVNATALSEAQRAQIEDIIKRKAEVSGENIVISTVVR